MQFNGFEQRYLRAIGLAECESPQKIEAALDRVYDLRKLEIDLYWRRATYFWAFQLVAFTSLGLALNAERPSPDLFALVSLLGFGSALSGWLTSLGSKFWQENWESHVDHLERRVGPRLTQVLVTKSTGSFSVSKLNRNFLFALTAGWFVNFFFVFVDEALPQLAAVLRPYEGSRWWLYLTVLCAGSVLLAVFSRTSMSGWEFVRGQSDWRRIGDDAQKESHRLIVRNYVGRSQTKPES